VNAASVIPGVSLYLPSVSKKADFGKSDPQDGRDMSCGHEFTLGTHSKTGAFWSQLDRFK
jgi:hypothetical protein